MPIIDKLNVAFLKKRNEAQSKVAFIDVFGTLVSIGANPTMSREKKLKALRENLDKLNNTDFADNLDNILKIIQSKKEQCEVFKSTREQVDSIYVIVPRLSNYETTVYDIINKRRESFNLPCDLKGG
jgi:hypothetical protein